MKPLIAAETTEPRAVTFTQALRIPVNICCLFHRRHSVNAFHTATSVCVFGLFLRTSKGELLAVSGFLGPVRFLQPKQHT